MATMTVTVSQQGSDVEFYIVCTGLVSAFTGHRRMWCSISGDIVVGTALSFDLNPSDDTRGSSEYYIYNASAGDTYNYEFELQWNGADDGDTNWQTALSESGTYVVQGPSVSLWDWTASNGDATDEQTEDAYLAVTGNGYLSDFSYLVWNDLCAKVKEVREAAGAGSWDRRPVPYGSTNYTLLSYEDTLMNAYDKEMTALRFNSLKYNVGSQSPIGTGINDVSTGDIIRGSYFTTITHSINVWINSL